MRSVEERVLVTLSRVDKGLAGQKTFFPFLRRGLVLRKRGTCHHHCHIENVERVTIIVLLRKRGTCHHSVTLENVEHVTIILLPRKHGMPP